MNIDYFLLNYIILAVFGTLNHFIYDWLGKKKILKIFFASSESTFEHMKLVLYPSLLGVVISSVCFDYSNIIFSSAIGCLISIILIPLMYYFYKCIIKKDIGIVNILIYFITIFGGTLINSCLVSLGLNNYNYIGLILYTFLIIFFTYYSYYPGKFIIFK